MFIYLLISVVVWPTLPIVNGIVSQWHAEDQILANIAKITTENRRKLVRKVCLLADFQLFPPLSCAFIVCICIFFLRCKVSLSTLFPPSNGFLALLPFVPAKMQGLFGASDEGEIKCQTKQQHLGLPWLGRLTRGSFVGILFLQCAERFSADSVLEIWMCCMWLGKKALGGWGCEPNKGTTPPAEGCGPLQANPFLMEINKNQAGGSKQKPSAKPPEAAVRSKRTRSIFWGKVHSCGRDARGHQDASAWTVLCFHRMHGGVWSVSMAALLLPSSPRPTASRCVPEPSNRHALNVSEFWDWKITSATESAKAFLLLAGVVEVFLSFFFNFFIIKKWILFVLSLHSYDV